MKNILTIDMDTDRDETIKITKPENLVESINDEESAKKMLVTDITTVCNTLGRLIQLGDDNNYFESKKIARMCVDYLNDNFINEDKDTVDITKEEMQ